MDCKNNERQIWEVLDKGELSEELASHISKCPKCTNLYKHITSLQKQFEKIEKLEPSAGFDERIIEKLTKEPAYFRILALINSFAVFVSLLFISSFAKRYFTEITVFCGKMLKIVEILSGKFSYGFYTFAILSFLSVIFLVILSGIFDVFLLSKLIKNGGEL